MRNWTWTVPLLAFAACRSSSAPAPEPAPPEPSPTFEERVDAFFRAELHDAPQLAVDLGFHEMDGQLPNMSAEALKHRVDRLRDALGVFERLETERQRQEYERQIVLNRIRTELFELDVLRLPFRNPMSYPGLAPLSEYISRNYAPEADRARAIVATCGGLPQLFVDARENIETPIPKTWIETALLQVRGLREFVKDDIPAAFTTLSAEEREQLETALVTCDDALAGYESYLDDQLPEGTDDFALGPDLFLQMLAETEALEIDLKQLEAIGRADLERNLATLDRVAAEMGKPVDEAVKLVMADKPAADRVLDVATEQAAEMRAFLDEQSIVSVPGTDRAVVKESPPFMRWNSAFLSSAGPFETKDLPSFYYISPPDPGWPEEVQRDYIPSRHDLLFVTIHEVWPGHFLHRLHGKASESKVAKAFCTYAMAEGWAHYTEEMMLEQGVRNGDPKVHIGQLQNALLRNVRYMSAIGLHAKDMTVEESKQLFLEKGLQDEGNARQQAVRGTFDPGYLNYTLGKLMIRKLHDDWRKQQGDAYSLKRFHDAFLSYQCAPVPVIRSLMLGSRDGVLTP
jgi:hypothetical protein